MLVPSGPTVWTLGHSNRAWDAFLALVEGHRIELLADVRHFPLSRHVPWATAPALAAALEAAGIGYVHHVDLGGYRKPRPDSTNTGLRSAGFRGYADHMETEAFRMALETLLGEASTRRTAIVCAEAVPWRCHRSFLSDALLVRGARVVHILGPREVRDHRLSELARVRGGLPRYPVPTGKALKPPRL